MRFQDLRYAVRGLVKQPGFTIVAVLTLAMGIGANTAIFTVADATLRRALPYPDPDALVTVNETRPRAEFAEIEASYPNFLDWQKQSRSFAALAGYGFDGMKLRSERGTELVRGLLVSASFFDALGARPALGRALAPTDEEPGAPPVVVLTHAAWQTRFGGDPGIVGQTLPADPPCTVVGVLPRSFAFGPATDAGFYRPLAPDGDRRTRRNLHWVNVVGRLAPGVSREQAQAEMSGLAGRLAQEYPDANAGAGTRVGSLEERIVGKVRPVVFVLWGAVALVLLVACANVANLMLARATSRQKELAIRAALGASRARLVGQITVESLTIAFAGGALGLVLAMWGIDVLTGFIPPAQLAAMPWLDGLGIDLTALLFAFAASTLTGVAIGVAAALRASRRDVRAVLVEEGRSTPGRARAQLRDLLVVAEVAVAFVLVVGAALIGRSLLEVVAVDPGFDPNNLLTVRARFSPRLDDQEPKLVGAHQELVDRLASIPGVRGVASVNVLPLSGGGNTIRYVVEGRPQAGRAADFEANIRQVSDNYFQVMGVKLVAGRLFQSSDRLDTPMVVVVNQTLAEKIFAGADPLAQKIRFTYQPGLPPMQIVGVVGDEKIASLDARTPPAIYLSFDQATSPFTSLVVRGIGDAGALAGSVRHEIQAFDADMALLDMQTMEERIARSQWMFVRRFPAILVGAFATLALVLAVVGLYGVLSYSIGQRTHEIGIRRAVGAQRGDIVRLVLVRAGALVATGTLAGLLIASGLTGLLRSLLFGVGAHDPATLAGAAALLALVALLACWVPVRRALKVDPIEALR